MNLNLKEKYQPLDVPGKKGNMCINRENRANGSYTSISNNLVNDSRLDLKEKGIMLHILSKPDGWYLNIDEITKNSRDGKKAIYSGIKKLKELGYITLDPIFNDKRQIERWDYKINEVSPLTIVNTDTRPLTQNLQVGKLQVETRSYSNTDLNNTKSSSNNKTEKTKTEIDYNNVENNLVEFSDMADRKVIDSALDNILCPDLTLNDEQIKPIRKEISKYLKLRNIDANLEMINIFPDFAIKNLEKGFSNAKSLNYLKSILDGTYGSYPNWFTKTLKKEQEIQAAKPLEDYTSKWASVFYVFGSGIYDNLIESKNQFISNSWFQCFNISDKPPAKARVKRVLEKISREEFIAEYSNILNTEALKKNSDIKEIIDLGIDNILNTISKAFDSVGA